MRVVTINCKFSLPGLIYNIIHDILQGTFNISNIVNGSAINYTIIYSDSTSGKSCSLITIPTSSCVNGICSHLFDVLSSSDCPASANITTTVFGSNVFGNGPPSNPTISGYYDNSTEINCGGKF